MQFFDQRSLTFFKKVSVNRCKNAAIYRCDCEVEAILEMDPDARKIA